MNKKIKNILKKKNKKKLVCLTAYSGNTAKLLDNYCDIILVGDSLGNVLYGMKNTHSVSLEMMIRHAMSVKKSVKKSLFVVDMPKGTYKNVPSAIKNAKKIIKNTQCDAVKIESNKKNFNIIKGLVKSNIQVMGHIGFTPQFKEKFKIEGKDITSQNRLINEALEIQKAGSFSIVLECINSDTAKKITSKLYIPTIGIGSSINCDGQVLVTDDLLGMSGFYPKFVKKYALINKIIEKAIQRYSKDVKTKRFPKKKNSY